MAARPGHAVTIIRSQSRFSRLEAADSDESMFTELSATSAMATRRAKASRGVHARRLEAHGQPHASDERVSKLTPLSNLRIAVGIALLRARAHPHYVVQLRSDAPCRPYNACWAMASAAHAADR